MRIVCIGGGPAGLYFALLMKRKHPAHDITVVERNRLEGNLPPELGQLARLKELERFSAAMTAPCT